MVIPLEAGLITYMDKKIYTVYILKSILTDKFYIGYTNNVARRISEHNSEDNKGWTKSFRPWKIFFTQKCENMIEAVRLEKYLKSLKNKDRIREYRAGWRSGISRGS